MAVMRQVVLVDIAMELPASHPYLVLREVDQPWREMRIPIGLPDGVAIAYAWRGLATPRPLSHELFADILGRLDVSLAMVHITEARGQAYFAELTLVGASTHVVPCRPSDAIALALRQPLPVPILVTEDLLGPPAEAQTPEAQTPEAQTPAAGAPEESSGG